MQVHLALARDTAQLVRGAEQGLPILTNDAKTALRFRTEDAARNWLATNTAGTFGHLVLLRAASVKPERR